MKNLWYVIMAVLLTNCLPNKTILAGHIGRPDISPDGNKIVFIYAKDASKDVWEIYSSDINGENVKQLTFFTEAALKKHLFGRQTAER